jgi:hypothetical protein
VARIGDSGPGAQEVTCRTLARIATIQRHDPGRIPSQDDLCMWLSAEGLRSLLVFGGGHVSLPAGSLCRAAWGSS